MIKKNLSFDESHEFNSLKIFSALFRDAPALFSSGILRDKNRSTPKPFVNR